MSVGFGFSVGDFIAAIELVTTVIDALQASGTARAEYRELVSQLRSLETALLHVKRLDGEEQYDEVIALRQAASQCQRTIEEFWTKASKQHPGLRGCGSRSRLKDSWMRVKWAVCKREDVVRFKADLVGHTESIQMILSVIQMRKTTLSEAKQNDQHRSLASELQEGFFNCMRRLNVATRQGKQLLEMTTKVLQTNIKVFQNVIQILQIVKNIAMNMNDNGQKPVYLLDALGRFSPFHLEFIRSAEALIGVLKVNFRKHGRGAEKIERGEFVIQDSATKRDIDLRRDWELCFSPGQRVDMSMICTRKEPLSVPTRMCPNCGHSTGSSEEVRDEDVECVKCGFTFRRLIQTIPTTLREMVYPESSTSEDELEVEDLLPPEVQIRYGSAAKRKHVEDEMANFRRVRLRERVLTLKPSEEPTGLYSSTQVRTTARADPAPVLYQEGLATEELTRRPMGRRPKIAWTTTRQKKLVRYYLSTNLDLQSIAKCLLEDDFRPSIRNVQSHLFMLLPDSRREWRMHRPSSGSMQCSKVQDSSCLSNLAMERATVREAQSIHSID